MPVQQEGDLTRLVAAFGVWWSAITLLASTHVAQRLMAPVWDAIGIDSADIALMPLGGFLGARFVVYMTRAAKRPEPPPLLGFLFALVVFAALAGVVYLYQADYYGDWAAPLTQHTPYGLLIGAIAGGMAALVVFLARNP